MLQTLYTYAKLIRNHGDISIYFSPAENPFEGREEKGKVLNGIVEDGKFIRFELEDLSRSLIPKYLYRRPPGANGTNTVPTLYVNTKDPDKTSKKIRQSMVNYSLDFISEEDLEKAIQIFEEYEFNKDYYYIITFSIDGKYFGEFEEYQTVFEDEAYKKYYQKNYGKTRKENQLCALTNNPATVYGFVDTLGFTVDSDSFRRNSFDANKAYTMFPVSEDAVPILEGARGILLNRLSTHFFGSLKYALIPHFVFQPDLSVAQYIASKFLDKAALNIDNKDGANGFVNDTELILNEIIADGELKRNDIYYTMLFFEQQQAQFKIHLELNDVLPSRIEKVLQAKKKAEDRYHIYTSYTTKKGEIRQQRITLFRLREYFISGQNNIQPAFFKLIQSIFTGQSYDDSKLLRMVLESWKKSFKENYHDQENTFNYLMKYSLGNLFFLNELEIFKSEYKMSEHNLTGERQDAFSFIEAHPAYFEKEYLKGAFIFGCLTTRLLYNQPGNAFMKELNGLNIDKDLISKKFPKLIARLRQYEKEFSSLEAAAMRYFASDDKVSKDEISFAFTMGLVLQKDFDRINKENKTLNTEENE